MRSSTRTRGCYVIKPRNVAHAFWNVGTAPARVMEIHAPGKFEGHYDEIGERDRAGLVGNARRATVNDIQRRYGVEFHWDRVPALIEQYDLAPTWTTTSPLKVYKAREGRSLGRSLPGLPNRCYRALDERDGEM